MKLALTFDDVLMVPQYSNIESRSEVDTSVDLGKRVKLQIPIISANMKSVTEKELARALVNLGGLPIMHRFYNSINEQHNNWTWSATNIYTPEKTGISVGVGDTAKKTLEKFWSYGSFKPWVVCLDIAHADSKAAIETCQYIRENYSNVLLIAGNVATKSGAKRLYEAGADVIKVGIGSGSICTTRVQTGHGVPQLSALMDVAELREEFPNIKIISDGGHKNYGDLVKALAFADAVMLGSMLAGTNEAPGQLVMENGSYYKIHAGSSTHRNNHVEGVVGMVPHTGPLKDVIGKIMEGIRSGCSYHGVSNLTDLKESPEFIQITNAGLVESRPHDIFLSK